MVGSPDVVGVGANQGRGLNMIDQVPFAPTSTTTRGYFFNPSITTNLNYFDGVEK